TTSKPEEIQNLNSETENLNSDRSASSDDCIYIENSRVLDKDIYKSELDESSLIQLAQQSLDQGLFNFYLNEFVKKQPYSTSLQSPPAVLLAAAIQGLEDSEPIETFNLEPWNS